MYYKSIFCEHANILDELKKKSLNEGWKTDQPNYCIINNNDKDKRVISIIKANIDNIIILYYRFKKINTLYLVAIYLPGSMPGG